MDAAGPDFFSYNAPTKYVLWFVYYIHQRKIERTLEQYTYMHDMYYDKTDINAWSYQSPQQTALLRY